MDDNSAPPPRSRNQTDPNATGSPRNGLVRLDGGQLRAVIEERLPRGVAELQDRWRWQAEARGNTANPNPPHRATIYRWIEGQMPRSKDDLLRLCAVLDVDPMCLLAMPEDNPEAAMERLATAYLHGRWEPQALEFLTSLLGRRTMWPPVWLARDYFGRNWFMRDVEHDATVRINYYLTLRITAADPDHRKAPYVYHVAFRHRQLFGQRWLQYGFVQRERDRVSLRHINGFVDRCVVEAGASTIVQTWAGPGSAVFRIASLHPFALDVIEEASVSKAMVRFPG